MGQARVNEVECQEKGLPGIHAVDISLLAVERDDYRTVPIGVGMIFDPGGLSHLNGEREFFTIWIDTGETPPGDGVDHRDFARVDLSSGAN
jgi:hypothetical protein